MLYSRNKLNHVGDDLIGTDPFKRNDALDLVQQWRETHLPVLQNLNSQIAGLLSASHADPTLSSMRIKRMTSIEAKLRNNLAKGMKLGGMQDIGGIRYVFPDTVRLEEAKRALDGFAPEGFTLRRRYDYVAEPKESGYRSIHYVYQYHSDDPKYDSLSVELQIRTRLQHAWAMAVETASLISNTTLKADIDNEAEWRGFFKLVSALFAREEGKPVHARYAGYTQKMLCDEFFEYENKKLIEQLKALRVTVASDLATDEKGYCVLTIDFVRRIVHAHVYGVDDYERAAEVFGKVESAINEDEAALMVAIEKVREIKEAYPSYFLDTKSFLDYLEDFDRKCRLL